MTLPIETSRLEALVKLAVERFGEPTDAEKEVLRLSASTDDLDPLKPEGRPELRAAFLRWIATDKDAAAHIDPLGLRIDNTTITSVLDLDCCKIPFRLRFRHCTIKEVFYLNSAELPALYLFNCTAERGISADLIRIHGGLYLRKLEAKGELRFLAAQIEGDFDCSGSTLTAEEDALSADRATITGGVFLREDFSSTGTIRLLGAQIGGSFDCSTATLTAKGDAIFADGATINGDVFFRGEFSSTGEIRFLGAHLGGNLECPGATLTATGNALYADGVKISGNVFLREKFTSLGKVRFLGAQIGGDLSCSSARMGTFACENLRLDGNLVWTAIREPKLSYLDLLGASIKTLHDDAESWPAPGNLVVKGLEYKELAHRQPSTEKHLNDNILAPQRRLDAGERVRWLSLQDDEDRPDPQPWMWLAKLFKEKGQDNDARWVILNYRFRQASAGTWLFWPVRVSIALLSWEPLLVLLPFLLILYWGSQTYQRAWDQQLIRPTAADAFTPKPAGTAPSAGATYAHAYPVFNPLIYTLENELPLVKFGIDDKWAPDPNLVGKGQPGTYWYLAGFRWFLILAGWAQGILLTIGINRRFHD